jgi:pyruvate dehydrogenase E2 component (dihydrolipoamide acetyltransferase)
MSRQEIVMPQMGESITNGTITKWHKSAGDEIALDELLFEISTDKVESEIPSPFKGRVEELFYSEGDTVDVGIKIAVIETDLSIEFSAGSSTSSKTPATPAKEETSAPATTNGSGSVAPAAITEIASGERRFYTPLVKAMAGDFGVSLNELQSIAGSGAGGRVNKKDLLNYVENKKPGGAPAVALTIPAAVSSVPAFQTGDRVEVIPMDNMRKMIAKNMVASKLTAPHVNSVSEVDLTHLVKYREANKDHFFKNEGYKLTYTPFIMYAIIQALKDFPLVNASVDGGNIIVKKDINLGCAVAVPGNGLVVPVIKNADSLQIVGIARSLNTLADKARNKKLTMDELTGGTFTFTNVGSFGTLLATPIILQPQVGIYASGVIQKRVMVMKDDAIAVRSMMYGTHTYDHRLVDGEQGGKFLEAIHRYLAELDPSKLL